METYTYISTTNKAAHEGRLDLHGACGLAMLCELRCIYYAHSRGVAHIHTRTYADAKIRNVSEKQRIRQMLFKKEVK